MTINFQEFDPFPKYWFGTKFTINHDGHVFEMTVTGIDAPKSGSNFGYTLESHPHQTEGNLHIWMEQGAIDAQLVMEYRSTPNWDFEAREERWGIYPGHMMQVKSKLRPRR